MAFVFFSKVSRWVRVNAERASSTTLGAGARGRARRGSYLNSVSLDTLHSFKSLGAKIQLSTEKLQMISFLANNCFLSLSDVFHDFFKRTLQIIQSPSVSIFQVAPTGTMGE
jgi:hypothetical protein